MEKVLHELGVKDKIILKLWNKIDKLEGSYYMDDYSVRISALTGEGIASLFEKIELLLQENMTLAARLKPFITSPASSLIPRK